MSDVKHCAGHQAWLLKRGCEFPGSDCSGGSCLANELRSGSLLLDSGKPNEAKQDFQLVLVSGTFCVLVQVPER